jgi:hypothetical protein
VGRWDWLYEVRPQPLKDYVLDRVAKELGDEIDRWPPRIESWESEEARLRFQPLLEGRVGRPPRGPLRLALRLARWDLQREFELIDKYMQGQHYKEDAPGQYDFDLAMFLWRYLTDQILSFKEQVGSRFTRAELCGVVDRLEKRLLETAEPWQRPAE